MNKIIFVLLLLILFRRTFILLLSFPFLRIYNKKAKRSFEELNIKQNEVNIPLLKKNFSLKIFILKYLAGFNRYCDLQCGQIPSHNLRNFMYRKIWLVDLTPKSVIYWGAEIRAGYNLTIGQGSVIGDKSLLDARSKIIIGENVVFSSNVSIYTEDHDHRDPYFRGNCDKSYRVKIEDRVWIGPNVIILHSVQIGEGSVVAAGSVVTKDIPPFSIVAGIPAKIIGQRNQDLRYIFNGDHIPFY